MTILYAKVIETKFITSPSGQIKPRVLVKTSDGEKREVSFYNFNNVYNNNIVPGTELEFEDNFLFSSLRKVTPRIDATNDELVYLLDLVQKCPTCGAVAKRYKLNYWCENIDCPASKPHRAHLLLKYSPILTIYNKKQIVTKLKDHQFDLSDLLDPDNINKYFDELCDRRIKFRVNEIPLMKVFYIDALLKWDIDNMLCCFDARISKPTAHVLSQQGRVSLEVVSKYKVKDMCDLGIKKLDASKIFTMMELDYNKKLMDKILNIERKIKHS